jgi:hypothetical protein
MKIKFKIKNRVMMILDNNQTILGSESVYTRKQDIKQPPERKKTNHKREKQLIGIDVIVDGVTAPIVSQSTNSTFILFSHSGT